jgi:RNA polymerase sigma-70 factor (ECF subfamily)
MTALQLLPPHQRTVLVLRDVLDWQASEVAALLDMTVSAVNSALHRARSTLVKHQLLAPERTAIKDDAHTLALLERYVRAWEAVDVAALVALLKEDATFSMPPFPAWFQSREAIAAFFTASVFTPNLSWRLRLIAAIGRHGFAAYQYDAATDSYQAHAIHVLAMDGNGINSLTAFLNPALFRHFGLPPTLEGQQRQPNAVA